MRCVSFPPITAKNAHTLILGSMPGVKSLELQQYYGHPQNAFWKIMAALFEMPAETYPQRIAIIKKNDLALWDSLKCCVRPGSLDSAIDKDSIEANDFLALFKQHPKITRVFFNGTTSETVFRKHVMPVLPPEIKSRLTFTRLPSTSPAHAGSTFKEKLKKWSVIAKS